MKKKEEKGPSQKVIFIYANLLNHPRELGQAMLCDSTYICHLCWGRGQKNREYKKHFEIGGEK